jgi:hypothetical protein
MQLWYSPNVMKRIGWAELGSAVAVLVSALSIDYDVNDVGERSGFIWTVQNNGLGPALIQSVIVSVDGKPQSNWNDVCKALGITKSFSSTMSEVSGRVLPPDMNRETTIDAIHVIAAPEAKLFYEGRKRLAMEICYCSVYEECWVAHFGKQKVDRVERCSTEGTVQFTQ